MLIEMNHLLVWLTRKALNQKYPEVSIPSSMMSSKMLFLQSSPSQFRHVALLSSEEKFIKKDFFLITFFHAK